MKGRVLIIAGTDSSGGAGVNADIKTVTALNGYASAAVAALTAQNTQAVFGVYDIPLDFILQQIEVTLSDIGTDAIKTGMLSKADIIAGLATYLEERKITAPLVLDPVMVAASGGRLLAENAVGALKEKLLPLASVATPNIPEAEVLLGRKIETPEDMRVAAKDLLVFGSKAILLKGGHLAGDDLVDVLFEQNGRETLFNGTRIHSRNTHGTGCSLASAIATGLAQNMAMIEAVARARDYVQEAIRTAPDLGQGCGPLNHAHTVKQ